jgi:dTDP-glucose 4,6-dehydratase
MTATRFDATRKLPVEMEWRRATKGDEAMVDVAGKTCVVFGAAGFIGSHLCDRLLDAGVTVIGADNESTGRWENVEHLQGVDAFTSVDHDVTEPFRVDGPVDFVVNLASPASPMDYLRLPLQTLRAGSLGTERALDLATEHDARFLLTSTSEVYGEPSEHPQKETYWGNVNPNGPRSVYDESKRYAEALTMAYRREHGTNTAIARVFNTYGPRMRIDDGRAVPAFIDAALRGDPLPIHGDGSQTRSLCFVSDLVEGLLLLLVSEESGPINLGNPEEVTVLRLAEVVAVEAGGSVDFEFQTRPVDDPSRRCPDITLAQRKLGWTPRVDLAHGIRQTVRWYRDERSATPAGTTGG